VSRTRTVLELVTLVVAPTSLLTALAFYFGWKLTESRAAYFGIDHSTLGFSTQDYLLRSADALFVPLGVILFAGLVALALHAFVSDCLARGRHRDALRRAVPMVAVAGAVLFAVGAFGVFRPLPFETHYLVVPLSPGLGIVLLAYAVYLHGQLSSSAGGAAAPRSRPTPGSLALVLVGLIVVLSMFWTVSEYADALGRGRAERLEAGLSSRPGVIVFSKEDLGLTGPGVVVERLRGASSAFRFRYSGLRLLIRSNDKYFLLPEQWTHSTGAAVVLPDAERLRFEFTTG
jgi:hypothetical protein